MVDPRNGRLPRRDFVRYGAAVAGVAGVQQLASGGRFQRPALPPVPASPGYRPGAPIQEGNVLNGSDGPVELRIGRSEAVVDGRRGRAVTINGTLPGPLLRFREGDEAVIHVTNELDEDTSVHWHGLILANGMDGVPKVNFPGIRPGETFTYRYPVRQYGTYWYHSHSGLQEQMGHYAPLVIDPAGGEPYEYDREHVIVLSDWMFEDPYRVLARLKKHPDYYNFQKRTVFDFFRDVFDRGLGETVDDRLAWGRMRMNPTDISDITGAVYTYLLNGRGPESNWTGLFEPGERVRLRIVNASAATLFDLRIPGLPMTVVQVSGQHVQPVETDEIRISIAETYDVIVEPRDEAYTLFAETIDRSGFARGTLATRPGLDAPVPERRERPLLTMADMGMMHMVGGEHDMAGMDMPAGGETSSGAEVSATGDMTVGADAHAGHDMGETTMLRAPGTLPDETMHSDDHHGPGNAGVAMTAGSRLHEPGLGLGDDGWRVLTYTQLRALDHRHDFAAPTREIELHLTGNMERFMWSIDGVEFSDAEPIRVALGERFRLIMVNDTMMNHPMHLHGMWMELENGHGDGIPRVHTVNVKPAEKVSLLCTPDVPGPWAFHCHVLYHMDAGMFRVFEVVDEGGGMHSGHVGTDQEVGG